MIHSSSSPRAPTEKNRKKMELEEFSTAFCPWLGRKRALLLSLLPAWDYSVAGKPPFLCKATLIFLGFTQFYPFKNFIL